jgi:hypothetical protein
MLNRRTFLRGITFGAGGVLLSPVVEQLRAHAAGEAGGRPRFVFVLLGNGLNPGFFVPKGIERRGKMNDRLVDQPLSKAELPYTLEPAAPFKDRLAILHGLSGRICGGGHSTYYGALGAFPGKKGAYAETIDLALAKARPAIFPHVCLGMANGADRTIAYTCSARAASQPVPIVLRPDLAYSQLFGSVAAGEARQAYQARGNLLDFMAEDIRKLQGNLAGEERERLQHYLAAYESMRDRRSRMAEIESTLRKHAPPVTDKFTSEVETDRLDAQFDIAAAALITGLTHVVTIASGVGGFWTVRFTGLGMEENTHQIGHGKGENGKTAGELAQIIRRFHVELIARLARKLQSVPEGSGTMLDNTAIVFMSDAAESHHSTCTEWPMIVLGDAGGKLKTRGRYLEYPYYGKPGNRTIANFYQTLLHAAGAPRDGFGVPDPNLTEAEQKGPLSELLA